MKYLYAYRNISIPANLVTIVCSYYFWTSESSVVLSITLWTKVVTSSIFIAYIHIFRAEVVLFYMNLGMGRQRFYASLFLIDLLVFVLLITLIDAVK